jgi:hypothetical protein
MGVVQLASLLQHRPLHCGGPVRPVNGLGGPAVPPDGSTTALAQAASGEQAGTESTILNDMENQEAQRIARQLTIAKELGFLTGTNDPTAGKLAAILKTFKATIADY